MTHAEISEAAGLTGRQRSILQYIHRHLSEEGYPPTIREIGDAHGISSPNGVYCHLIALERKGFIARDETTARGITLRGMVVRTEYTDDEAGRLLRLAVGHGDKEATA